MPATSKKPGRRGSGRMSAPTLKSVRSSETSSEEWFLRSSKMGGCFDKFIIMVSFRRASESPHIGKDAGGGKMFHAFRVETGYFVSKEFHPYFGPQQPSLTNVVIRKKYLPYRPSPSDSAGQRFFERSVGTWLKQSKLPKGVRRRSIRISAGAIIIFW